MYIEVDDFNTNLNDLLGISTPQEVSSSDELPHAKKDENQLDERNEIYTNILNLYYDYIKSTLKKNIHLRDNLIGSMVSILILTLVFTFLSIVLVISQNLDLSNTIMALGTVFVSLLTSFIIIPTKISEYAFNKEETNQISSIIKNIQEYDMAVRDDRQKYNSYLSSNKQNKE